MFFSVHKDAIIYNVARGIAFDFILTCHFLNNWLNNVRCAMWKEFKEFVLKGPVMSLAIGVIIGAAFGKIVDSAVKDLIMPIIGAIFGGKVDFTNMFVVLGHTPDGVPHTYDALTKAGANVFAYGSFITVLVNFVMLALGVFIIVKLVNKLYQEKQDEAGPTEDVLLLREIRDSLKK